MRNISTEPSPTDAGPLVDAIALILRRAYATGAEAEDELESLSSTPAATDFHAMARTLITDALSGGLAASLDFSTEQRPASEGATAQHVSFNTVGLNFVLKADFARKLVLEANNLREIRAREDLPASFRVLFPQVFSVKADEAPYAYLMERFSNCASYSELLFRDGIQPDSAVHIADAVLQALESAVRATVNRLLVPGVSETYLGRITSRLEEASGHDAEFAAIVGMPLTVNGVRYDQPTVYVRRIEDMIHRFSVGFSTFVHGDSHPENILVRGDRPVDRPEVRFIDPKEWRAGDYLFDIGKLRHYIEVTGPAEIVADPPQIRLSNNGGEASLDYALAVSLTARAVLDRIAIRTRLLAEELGDANWERRLNLSMASNLLGLPAGRLKPTKDGRAGRRDSAFILYAEGLRYLAACCE